MGTGVRKVGKSYQWYCNTGDSFYGPKFKTADSAWLYPLVADRHMFVTYPGMPFQPDPRCIKEEYSLLLKLDAETAEKIDESYRFKLAEHYGEYPIPLWD